MFFNKALLTKSPIIPVVGYYVNLVGNQHIPVEKATGTYTEQGITTNIPSYSLSTVIRNSTNTIVGSISNLYKEWWTITYTVTGDGQTLTATRYVYITDSAVTTFTVGTATSTTSSGAVSIPLTAISEQYVTFQAYTNAGLTTAIGTSVSNNATTTATISFTDTTGKVSSKTYYIKATDTGGYTNTGVGTFASSAVNVTSVSKAVAPAATNIPANTALYFVAPVYSTASIVIHQLTGSGTFTSPFTGGEYGGTGFRFGPIGHSTNGSEALNDNSLSYSTHQCTWTTTSAVRFLCVTGGSVLADGATFTLYIGAAAGVTAYPASFTVYGATITSYANPPAGTSTGFQYGTLTRGAISSVTNGTYTRTTVVYTYSTS